MITFQTAAGFNAVRPKYVVRHRGYESSKGNAMKYITSWTLPQGTFNAVVARFLETGGAPPKGVQLLGRWHGMSGQGFAIAESNDAKAMYLWQAQ